MRSDASMYFSGGGTPEKEIRMRIFDQRRVYIWCEACKAPFLRAYHAEQVEENVGHRVSLPAGLHAQQLTVSAKILIEI